MCAKGINSSQRYYWAAARANVKPTHVKTAYKGSLKMKMFCLDRWRYKSRLASILHDCEIENARAVALTLAIGNESMVGLSMLKCLKELLYSIFVYIIQ